jgi:hypothetical protein
LFNSWPPGVGRDYNREIIFTCVYIGKNPLKSSFPEAADQIDSILVLKNHPCMKGIQVSSNKESICPSSKGK